MKIVTISAMVTIVVCLAGCVPPPNGGRVTGTELRDLFASKSDVQKMKEIEKSDLKSEDDFRAFLQKRIDQNHILVNRQWYNDITSKQYGSRKFIEIFDSAEDGGIPATVLKNNVNRDEDVFKFPLFFEKEVKNEFGNVNKQKATICPADYFLKVSHNGADFLMSDSTKRYKMLRAKGPDYLSATMINAEVNMMIQKGEIASSVVLDIDEYETRGKSFKKQVGAQQIAIMIGSYLSGNGEDTTSVSRKRLITALLIKNKSPFWDIGTNYDCSVSIRSSAIRFMLSDTSASTIKFLNALAANNQEKATNVLLSDPYIKELFLKNQ